MILRNFPALFYRFCAAVSRFSKEGKLVLLCCVAGPSLRLRLGLGGEFAGEEALAEIAFDEGIEAAAQQVTRGNENEAAPRPVVNAEGQTTGRVISTSA
jgi:hypothetical protein